VWRGSSSLSWRCGEQSGDRWPAFGTHGPVDVAHSTTQGRLGSREDNDSLTARRAHNRTVALVGPPRTHLQRVRRLVRALPDFAPDDSDDEGDRGHEEDRGSRTSAPTPRARQYANHDPSGDCRNEG
jgi:hypothetical protein